MRNLKSIIGLLILLCSFDLHSQIENLPGTLNKPLRETEKYQQTQGSPYFIDDYNNGILIDTKGREYKVYIKYDTFKEELEIFNDGTPLLVDKGIYPKFKIEYIDNKSKKKVQHFFSNEQVIPGFKRQKYSMVLADGDDVKLLKIFQTFLSKSDDQGYAGSEAPASFSQKEFYFLVKNGEVPVQIKMGNKAVLKALDTDGSLKAYFKKNKVKIRREGDLIELLNYLNNKG